MAEEQSERKLICDEKFKEKDRKSKLLILEGRKALKDRHFKNAAASFRRAIEERVDLFGEPRLGIKDCCRAVLVLMMDTVVVYEVEEGHDVSKDEEPSIDNEKVTKDLDLASQMMNEANKLAVEELPACSLERVDLLNINAKLAVWRDDPELGLSLYKEAKEVLAGLKIESCSLLLIVQNMRLCDTYLKLEGMCNAGKGIEHLEIALKLLRSLQIHLSQLFADGQKVSEMTYFPRRSVSSSDVLRSFDDKKFRTVDSEMIDDIFYRARKVEYTLKFLRGKYGVKDVIKDEDEFGFEGH